MHSFMWKAICHPDSKARRQQDWPGGFKGLAIAQREVIPWRGSVSWQCRAKLVWGRKPFFYFRYLDIFVYLMFGESCRGNYPQVVSAQFLCKLLCNAWFFQINGRLSVSRQLTSVMLSKSWTLLMSFTPLVTAVLLWCGRMRFSYSV